ncbi:MAG: ABC transporter substrate-binding protein [Dongiaceae bacterium]
MIRVAGISAALCLFVGAALGTVPSAAQPAGTLTVALETELAPIDPVKDVAVLSTVTALRHIFDPLVDLTPEGEFVPRLAESWERPDELTWIFKLRQNARFHDGTPVTAADVAATILVLRDGRYSISQLWTVLESAEAIDDHTLRLVTKNPVATMLYAAALVFPAPAAHFEETKYIAGGNIIGSGPFRVESFRPDDALVMLANEDYWGAVPKVEKLVLREIPEMTAKLTALRTGEIDIVVQLPGSQLKLLENDPSIRIMTEISYGIYCNWMNNNVDHRLLGGPADRNPFADVRVRKAMWHAVNTKLIADTLMKGTAVESRGPVTSSVSGYSEQPPYEYDPEKARRLLAEAGYPDGFNTSIMLTSTYIENLSYAFAMISDWAAIGVNVQPVELEYSTWNERLRASEFDMALFPNFAYTGDAEWSIGRLYVTNNKRLGYSNARVDDLVQQGRSETDPDKRAAIYKEINQIIWDEAPSMWPLQLLVNYAVRDRVQDFVPAPSQIPDFRSVSVTN